MANQAARYREMERVMLRALLVDVGFFLLFLLFSGLGIGVVKVIFAVLGIVLSILGLGSLFLTRELFRRRSRYLVFGFAAVLLCVVVSLIAHYPSPMPDVVTKGALPVTTAVFRNLL